MVTDSLRVTYQFDCCAWALAHGNNLMPVGGRVFHERRDELVNLMTESGFIVDHYGYIH